ncbi:MAG: hypothetical protein PHY16_02810 [Methylobacter sp.]|nr:hypothetical protein [Methylobacter sp.]
MAGWQGLLKLTVSSRADQQSHCISLSVICSQTPKTLNRLIHLCSFAVSGLPILFQKWFWKPDVVITIEPTFLHTCLIAVLQTWQ